MTVLRFIPVVLSALLLGAHFLRAGLIPIALLSLLFPSLLFIRRAWAARFVQIILALGAFEWIRTLLVLVAERQAEGQPWYRLAIILGLVVAVTAGAAMVFSFCRSLRKTYGLDSSPM